MKGRGKGRWGRGSGRALRWAPVVSDRSGGSVDPQSFWEDDAPAPTSRGPQLEQVPLPVLDDVGPGQVVVLEPGDLAVGVALAGEGEHLTAGHVLTPPGAGRDPGHRAGGVHHAARQLARLRLQHPVLGAGVLTPELPDVPVGVLHQVGVGEYVGGVEPREETVILVVVIRESEAEAVAELFTATPYNGVERVLS